MKNRIIKSFSGVVVLAVILMAGCGDKPISETTDDNDKSKMEACLQGLAPPTENIGLTSANVRFHFAIGQDLGFCIPDDWTFDLSKSERYHEFVNYEHIKSEKEHIAGWNPIRIVFTAERAVRDFRFITVFTNHDLFFSENADENERLYLVTNVLYYLEELVPEIPFVVTGANMGCVLAANGFSFVDEYGIIRHFVFTWGNPEFDPVVSIREF